MGKKKPGRPRWSPPDGVTRQKPSQTAKANVARRPGSSPYDTMRMQLKSKHTLDRPGYGRTGHFEGH